MFPEEEDCDAGGERDKPREHCGVFGIMCPPKIRAAPYGVYAMHSLQHRGQESCGLATAQVGHCSVNVHRGMGLVNQVFKRDADCDHLLGNMCVGHTRYSTAGGSVDINAQPVVVETARGHMAVAFNGNLVQGKGLRRRLLEKGVGLFLSTDTEVITQMLHSALAHRGDTPEDEDRSWEERFRAFMGACAGAYSVAVMTPGHIYALRDKHGLRPLCLGTVETKEGTAYMVASESCAFSTLGGTMLREVEPGEIVRLDADGFHHVEGVEAAVPKAMCVFEYVYFARPDSMIEDQQVHTVRQRLGAQLADEAPVPDADIVIAVPDSGMPAAIGYAKRSRKPFTEGFTKNRYIGRTFLQPTQELRQNQILLKFNTLPGNLRGQKVVVIDDSIVRGNTLTRLVAALREGGAAEVHVRITAPPIRHPCFMGIDMATHEELIAHTLSVDEIKAHIGADSLAYLTHEGMMKAVGGGGSCGACFTGEYPLDVIDW